MIRSHLRVLAYHRIGGVDDRTSGPSLFSATPADFERQVGYLAERYRVIPLEDVLRAQRGEQSLPRRAVLLTFDDGYRDFGEIAWPILRRYRLPATLFVPTDYPDPCGRAFWWDRVHRAISGTTRPEVHLPLVGTLRLDTEDARRESVRTVQHRIKTVEHVRAMALVDQLCAELNVEQDEGSSVLGWNELRELAKDGLSIAAHTRSHAALTQLDAAAVRSEVAGSLADVKREIGTVLPVFCYPFGLHDDSSVEEVRKLGVELAFTCLEGHNPIPSGDALRLRRTTITRRTSPVIFGLRLRKTVAHFDVWRQRRKQPAMAREGTGREGVRPSPDRETPVKLGYIMSRFPKLSETFILNEIVTLESLGVGIEVYPLLRERQPVSHPEVERWVRRARFQPFISLSILRTHAHFIRHRPGAYFRVLFEVLSKTAGSANFFLGALSIFPKTVQFAHHMRQNGITHVHAHFATHPAVAALIVHRLTGIPFSFIAHGSDLHVERRMLDAKVEAAAFAITVSNFNKEVMVSTCGEHLRDKIHVIHCGVDPQFFAPPATPRGRAGFEIICVASLEEVKGHRFLIEACGILRDRGIEFRCHMVGDGPLRHEIEAQVMREDLSGHIRLHGGKPRQEVAALLAASDVAVLASHPTAGGKREGIPVALMEAMAAGLPVVASDLTGIPELVDHESTGFLVPSGEPVALADALERLSNDSALREHMALMGREKVAREFDLDTNTRELLNLFCGCPRSQPTVTSFAAV